jgi:glycosyltransferase involved in cell wall biosynthesis
MPDSSKTLVILAPAFPENEEPTTWVTSQQLLVRSLKDNFPKMNIIVLAFFYPYHEAEYDWNNVRVVSFNGMKDRKLQRIVLWQKIWRKLNKIRQENNLIGILSFWCGECALIGRYFSKRYGVKHYCWICGQDARRQNKLVKLIRPQSHELVAMSTFLVNEFYKNHGIKPQHIIPNAIDQRQFSLQPPGKRDIDIMGAGSLIPLKQYSLFVNIVKSLQQQIPDINAIISGEGEERAKLESLIKSHGLTKNIALPGLTPHQELLQLMQRTKVFLHTSGYEGFSTVCLEALYAGAQVISFCDPMEGKIPNWHIVHTAKEMTEKAIELLLSPHTTHKPVLVYAIEDSAKTMIKLFDTSNKENSRIIEQNISIYNETANSYDHTMDKDHSNKLVRQKVKEKLLGLLKSGWVLDFGGGTGLDLEWLTPDRYNIFFCEPSIAMREKAIQYNNNILHNNNITFLDTGKTDFTRWHQELPFSQKMDAILSNFGVINYIPDIELLFKNLARVIKPGGHFIAIILNLPFKKRLKWHRRNTIRSFIFRIPFVMYIPYEKELRQIVIVHTVKEIKKASAYYFDYCSHESLTESDFILIHLVRNETPNQEMVNG